jgi:hypothetical protein
MLCIFLHGRVSSAWNIQDYELRNPARHVDGSTQECARNSLNSPSRVVCTNWDQSKIKRASQISNLLEGRTLRVGVIFIVVIHVVWEFWNSSIAGVTRSTYPQSPAPITGKCPWRCIPSKPNLLSPALHTPRCPKRCISISDSSSTRMLTWQTSNFRRNAPWIVRIRLGLCERKLHITFLPPIQLSDIMNATCCEPILITQRHENGDIGM